jgi:hypothetical protein
MGGLFVIFFGFLPFFAGSSVGFTILTGLRVIAVFLRF